MIRHARAVLTPGTYFRNAAPDIRTKPAIIAAVLAAIVSIGASATAMWVIVSGIPSGATFATDGGTVPARATARAAATRQLGFLIPGAFFGWVGLVVAVHVGSLLDAPAGDLTDSVAVASWASVPSAVESVVRSAVIAAFVMHSGRIATTAELKRRVTGSVDLLQGGAGLAVRAGAAVWLGYIVYQGLRHARGMRRDGAALVGGTLALFVTVLGSV